MANGFDKIIGQNLLKNMMLNSIKENMVSHAYIIEGDMGMGKKLLAYTFASYLVCESKSCCQTCSGCVMAKAGTHPDIITVKPAEGKKTIGVDEIRAVVSETVVKPYTASKKVIIIPECDIMTIPAQNALLKVLEEPPEYIVFLLLIKNSNYFLETVRSRSIKLQMKPYTTEEVKRGIQDINTQNNIDNILAYCGNNIGKAKTLILDEEFAKLRNDILIKMNLLTDKNKYSIFDIISVFDTYKDRTGDLTDCMLSFLRDVILIKVGCKNIIQNTDIIDLIENFETQTDMRGCLIVSNDILKTKEMLSRNANYNLVITALINGSWEVLNGRNSWSSF